MVQTSHSEMCEYGNFRHNQTNTKRPHLVINIQIIFIIQQLRYETKNYYYNMIQYITTAIYSLKTQNHRVAQSTAQLTAPVLLHLYSVHEQAANVTLCFSYQ